MKNLFTFLFVISFCAFFFSSSTMANEVYVEGEGYVIPTEKSQVPFDPQLLLVRPTFGKGTLEVGDTVTANTLATGFPYIILYVTVLDSNGNSITGLQQDDFTVTEQSSTESGPTAETITCFSESTSGSSGISFSLVFDVSGSMGGQRLDDAKAAAINFINNSGSNDRASLVKFSDDFDVEIVMAADWVNTDNNSNGTPDIIDAINNLTIGNLTALYDGTAKGIEILSQEPTPKAVIVFTDGQANDDVVHNINSVIAMANNDSIPLYTIGLGIDPQNLRDMASATGGTYHYAPTAQDMNDIYTDIAQELQSQYMLCYTSHNSTLDGTTRTATVTYDVSSGASVYVVNFKPQIALDPSTVLLSSQSQQPSVDLNISGTLTDLDAQGQGQSLSATLFYRYVSAGTYTSLPLGLVDQGNGVYTFSGLLPAAVVQEPGVQYYVHAGDGLQETYSPFNYNVLPHSISVLQNHGPVIVHAPVGSAVVNQPVSIVADVTDPDSGDSVSQVVLYYRVHNPNQNTPYFSAVMTSSNGVTFTGSIPADKVTDSGMDYFISAWDGYQVRSDKGSALLPYTINVSSANIQINLTDPPNCSPVVDFSATISIQ